MKSEILTGPSQQESAQPCSEEIQAGFLEVMVPDRWVEYGPGGEKMAGRRARANHVAGSGWV